MSTGPEATISAARFDAIVSTWTASSPRPRPCTPPPGRRSSTPSSKNVPCYRRTVPALRHRDDYLPYVDGKARYDGVRDFLASRGIALPWGGPSDPPDAETVCGLGNRKNDYFVRVVAEHGVKPFPTTVALIARLQKAGVAHGGHLGQQEHDAILNAAGVAGLFAAQVDGTVAEELGLPGKPDPAVFVEAARRGRRAAPGRGRRRRRSGGRGGPARRLWPRHRRRSLRPRAGAEADHGADVVVKDLGEVTVVPR